MIHPVANTADKAQESAQRGTRQLFLSLGFVLASGYVTTVILTRQLGPVAYGIYGVVISQLVWLEMSANSGVVSAIAKVIANGRHDHGEIERSARALLLLFSASLLAVCWTLAPQLASLMHISGGELLFRIAIVDLPFAAVFASYNGILIGRRQFGVLAMAHVVQGITKLAGVIVLIGLGLSVERVLIISVVSTFVICTVLAVRYRSRGFRPSGSIMREIAVLNTPMASYVISAQVLVSLDLWSLKGLWRGGDEVVGHYVAAMNLAKFLMVIPVAQAGVLFASVALAVASQNTARARRHIQDATRFAVIIAAAAWVILGLDASEILSLLFSDAYADGQRFLPLQLAGFSLFALLDAFARALMAAGRQWFVAGALAVTVPLAWLSNYLLIPSLGPMGAVISLLFGLSIGTVLTGTMAYRQFGSLVHPPMLLRVLVAAGSTALVSTACPVRGSLVMIKVALLGGLYLLVLYMLGEITGRDFALGRKSPAEHSA